MGNSLTFTTMKNFPLVRGLLFAGACSVLTLTAGAQVIELRATINAAQETPASTSPATGSAIMLYDIGTNTFDLVVSISGISNTATASHIHEAATGVAGSVVTNLGAEAVYTRSGNTLTATFRNVTHGGDKLKLIQGGAYYNIHSAQFPGGEVRGQLIPRPVRLVANLDVAQEQAAFPAVNLSTVTNFGGAVLAYDPMANTVTIRHSLYGFTSTFTNSHIHTGVPGVSGGVNTSLGTSATAGAYNSNNGLISGAHDAITYAGDPIQLLTGGNYLNYHSQAFPNGQLRGQLRVSNEIPSTRLGNLSVRGFVGTGEQVLIQGISVTGAEPVRVMISAKGPSLSAFGITSPLANPRLTLYDSSRREIANNDDVGAPVAGSEQSRIPGYPANTVESALVLVLPPGNYTAIVSASAGTGVALLEVTDLRNLGGVVTSSTEDLKLALLRDRTPATAKVATQSVSARTAAAVLELCGDVPVTGAVVAKR